jgi:hypothetical protein
MERIMRVQLECEDGRLGVGRLVVYAFIAEDMRRGRKRTLVGRLVFKPGFILTWGPSSWKDETLESPWFVVLDWYVVCNVAIGSG